MVVISKASRYSPCVKTAHIETIVIYELESQKDCQSMPVTNIYRFLVSVNTGS
jgi:hypothetical protein